MPDFEKTIIELMRELLKQGLAGVGKRIDEISGDQRYQRGILFDMAETLRKISVRLALLEAPRLTKTNGQRFRSYARAGAVPAAVVTLWELARLVGGTLNWW